MRADASVFGGPNDGDPVCGVTICRSIVTEAEQHGGPVWMYVDPTETVRIAELHAALAAFSEFGISG